MIHPSNFFTVSFDLTRTGEEQTPGWLQEAILLDITTRQFSDFVDLWRVAYAPGDVQTSLAYSGQPVQYLYINRLLSVNKPVLSCLLLRFLPQTFIFLPNMFKKPLF
jgi:hypothetical protein